LAKLTLEDADRARPADIVRHQDVGLDPHIVSCLNPGFASRPGKYLLHPRSAEYLRGA